AAPGNEAALRQNWPRRGPRRRTTRPIGPTTSCAIRPVVPDRLLGVVPGECRLAYHFDYGRGSPGGCAGAQQLLRPCEGRSEVIVDMEQRFAHRWHNRYRRVYSELVRAAQRPMRSALKRIDDKTFVQDF